ncbi:Thiopurine S-methyltransferase [Orchesella cincta]|uniref:Thiopurine S-methyltransferase n=1 Tax=Orchesella cincta TaxID=48709 RepID=A0A1D2N7P6_ORCCI|nr:Thiopurine S-methyltransferase [Orchesella cincta]
MTVQQVHVHDRNVGERTNIERRVKSNVPIKMAEANSVTENSSDPFNVAYWKKRWEENQVGFHRNEINPYLLRQIELVTGQKLTAEPIGDTAQFVENSKKTWFVPLCGKTMDIPYLLSQGFRVFGLEAAKLAIEALDQEHSLCLTYNEETKLFTGADGLLQIYMGDLFDCPIEKFGPFDYVWDRGSFVALEYPFRSSYIEVMQRALKKPDGSWYNFKYLMDSVQYDKSKFGGPPRSVDDEDIDKFFKSWCSVQRVESEVLPEDSRVAKAVGGDTFVHIYFLMPL